MTQSKAKSHRPDLKSFAFIGLVFCLCIQWMYFKLGGHVLHTPWNVILPGIGIFGAAYMLSWGAELAQFEIPQSLAIAFLALVAVLPEYAVDMYFAWNAAEHPEYLHYATANMTGANRLLIGVGWAAVVFAYWIKSKKGEIILETSNRLEILGLTLATLYSFVIPIKGTITLLDSAVLFSIFSFYIWRAIKGKREEPEAEGPIEFIAYFPRFKRAFVAILFFAVAGFTIFIAAEPFAEGILDAGRHWGIEEFLLVQWLAPLASESPEFIVAILFALRLRPQQSLSTLLSSKVNQWTLLVGALPIVYSIAIGHISPMILDERQAEEIFLTAAQSLFAIVVVLNLRFSITEALLLFVFFITQAFFTDTQSRIVYAYVYIALSIGWFFVIPGNRKSFVALLKFKKF